MVALSTEITALVFRYTFVEIIDFNRGMLSPRFLLDIRYRTIALTISRRKAQYVFRSLSVPVFSYFRSNADVMEHYFCVDFIPEEIPAMDRENYVLDRTRLIRSFTMKTRTLKFLSCFCSQTFCTRDGDVSFNYQLTNASSAIICDTQSSSLMVENQLNLLNTIAVEEQSVHSLLSSKIKTSSTRHFEFEFESHQKDTGRETSELSQTN